MSGFAQNLKNWWPVVLIAVAASVVGGAKLLIGTGAEIACSVRPQACGTFYGVIYDTGLSSIPGYGDEEEIQDSNRRFRDFLRKHESGNVDLDVRLFAGRKRNKSCRSGLHKGYLCIYETYVRITYADGVRELGPYRELGELYALKGKFYVNFTVNEEVGRHFELDSPL